MYNEFIGAHKEWKQDWSFGQIAGLAAYIIIGLGLPLLVVLGISMQLLLGR